MHAKEERFLFFEPCRTLVAICMELLLNETFYWLSGFITELQVYAQYSIKMR